MALQHEFYKFFWKDLQFFLLKSYQETYECGCFSVSQRRGIITCIPKEGKSKFYIKNWRPITLLNCDIKIASAALANRIKPILQDLISDTQKGFLKGRYIGECTRTILDILHRAEEEDIPGLLLLLDFEKAFDTVEWSFIQKTLQFFNFGDSFCHWVKTLYFDISSCVSNNGHCSDFFKLERGVRQGDPLSPYLFILVIELLSARIKLDPNINGIKFDNSEYLISQYADDSSLILDDSVQSLDQTLFLLDSFAECAGLRANLEKTQAIWIGARRGCGQVLLPDKPLLWNHAAKFKLLGISYNLAEEDITIGNFREKIENVKKLLNTWLYRDLTYIGKIVVIKTLALPVLIQILTVLPRPPVEIFKELESIFFQFVWGGKTDKIRRRVIYNQYEKGGLKMPHMDSFCSALKMTWIHKLLDPENHSQWKLILIDFIEKHGGDKFFSLPKFGIENIAKKLNSFWKDIFFTWANVRGDIQVEDYTDVLRQPLWLNPMIKVNQKLVF